MMPILYVACGGALGAALRYLVMSAIGRAIAGSFPYGTLTVNILGSVLMGVLVGALAKWGDESQQALRLFLAVGVLGGFTTFSAFSLDVASMLQRNEMMPALLYMLGSVVLSVLGLFAGLLLIREMI